MQLFQKFDELNGAYKVSFYLLTAYMVALFLAQYVNFDEKVLMALSNAVIWAFMQFGIKKAE